MTGGSRPAAATLPPAPTVADVVGRSVVLTYGSVAAEYEALRTRAIIVDRSHRGRMRFTGDKAGDTLTGLLTNDVLALAPGHGLYALALTPKGKIIADVRVFAEDDGYLVDAPARAWDGWTAMVRKYVNPRVSPYRDESATMRDLGVFGAEARHAVAEMTGMSASVLGVLPPYAHATVELDGARLTVARVADLGVEGFELFVPADAFDALWARALAARATPAGLAAWEIARVEAGRPEWGLDMDESTLAQEANMDDLHAISYTKGCYTGQEVVARVHFRGHVNRVLRGVRSAASEPPPRGAQLFDAGGAQVGDVRSGAASPRLGGIALAVLRREVEPGTSLVARLPAPAEPTEGAAPREWQLDVVALPFAG